MCHFPYNCDLHVSQYPIVISAVTCIVLNELQLCVVPISGIDRMTLIVLIAGNIIAQDAAVILISITILV